MTCHWRYRTDRSKFHSPVEHRNGTVDRSQQSFLICAISWLFRFFADMGPIRVLPKFSIQATRISLRRYLVAYLGRIRITAALRDCVFGSMTSLMVTATR